MPIDADKLRQAAEDVETLDSELVNFYRTAMHLGFEPDGLGTVSLERALKVYGTSLSEDRETIVEQLRNAGSCEINVPDHDADTLHALRIAWIDGALTGRKLNGQS
jgi:hypothetical protein